ncbi:LacI family DNA-binding transcriptional regulator [Streptomyces antimycoticus]|uniref:LacI family DNA-binding transcriptional regulator n=1 Tax=Streptomyces antimycoticus TaxID=68175 RepID=UPI00256FCD20|nr:LacI family DNA-binding transcriptional regulator [Streptomyces antimycoticus]WJE01935.1 LacI family DNA-binding transcriptional regulator [Streptomyces antimycoticus]
MVRGQDRPGGSADGSRQATPPRPRRGGGSRPTIGDVAALAQVSKATVSFVINDRPGVSPQARQRVLEAIDQLGWQPNAGARALSTKRSQTLGLVMRRPPELLSTDPFFPQFVAGIETGLAPLGYALVLQVVPDEETERQAYERLARDGRVDGVFLTDLRTDDPRPALMTELGISALIVGPSQHGGRVPALGVDDGSGVRRAVSHLRSLGHRWIGHVCGAAGYVHTEARCDAWRGALADAGLPEIPPVAADFTGAVGAQATHQLLDLDRPPTAIVYANDLMAVAGITAATSRGLRVPEDLSVVGFDDIPLADCIAPPLTTVRQDVLTWGRTAAQALVSLTEGGEFQAAELPPVEFVVRASTAPPRT